MDTAADLAAWSRRRDEAAFGRLVARHAALVAAACRRQLGAGDAADEAVQAVFIVLARRAGGIAGPERLGAWLYGVAIRVCRDARRSQARRRRHEQEAVMASAPPASSDPDLGELRGLLDQAIAALSPAQREVVVGHFLEERSQVAVAAGLGISEDAVRMRLRDAVERLRGWFGQRGLPVGAGALTACLAGEAGTAEPALVAVCTQTALHPVAGSAAALLAGGAALSGLATTAVAAGVLLLLAAGGGLAVWRNLHPGPAWPVSAVAMSGLPGPALERILATRLAVHYQRDSLAEVLADLRQQAGLDAACPPGLGESITLSFTAGDVAVRGVLEELARAGGLSVECHGDRLALWKPADPARLARLAEQLGQGDPEARISAVYGLSRLGDPRIYPCLFRALEDPDGRVVQAALHLLRLHPLALQSLAPLPAPRLAALAVADPRDWEAFIAAGEILAAGEAVDQLAALARTPGINRSYRGSAIRALGSLHDARAVEALVGLLADRETCFAASIALARLAEQGGAPQAVGALLAQLNDRMRARETVIWSLGRSHDPRVVEPLTALLEDPEPSVRHAAATALGTLRDARAQAALAKAAEQPDSGIQQLAADALFRIRVPATVEALAPQLAAADPAQRRRAITGLGELRDPRAVPLLISALGDVEGELRRLAVLILAERHDPRAVDPLIARLGDPDPQLRQGALQALGRLRQGAGLDACLALLPGGDLATRRSAANALIQARDPRLLPTFIDLLADPDPQLRLIACLGLGSLRDARAAEALLPVLGGGDRNLARNAATALCQIFDLRIFDSTPITALVNPGPSRRHFACVTVDQALAASPGLPAGIGTALATWAATEAKAAARPAAIPPAAVERSDF